MAKQKHRLDNEPPGETNSRQSDNLRQGYNSDEESVAEQPNNGSPESYGWDRREKGKENSRNNPEEAA